jgi:hypothetical protein
MNRIFISVFALLTAVLPVRADVRIVPVMGDIELSAGEVSCPSLPSGYMLCINDEDTTGDNRLIIAIGETYPFIVTTGYAAGVVRPFVVIDGVRLTPDLFPCGAYLRCGVSWSDYFTPYSCDGTSPGVTYQIGSMPEVTVTGDGSTHVDIPATDGGTAASPGYLVNGGFWNVVDQIHIGPTSAVASPVSLPNPRRRESYWDGPSGTPAAWLDSTFIARTG